MIKMGKANYKVRLFVISLLTVGFIFVSWWYMLQELNNYKDSIIKNYISNQESLVTEVAKKVKESLLAASAGPEYSQGQGETSVVSDILGNAGTSGSKYWFVYSSTGAIFERNYDVTENIKGKSTSELIQYWKLQGGAGMDDFENLLLRKQNGSSVFTKSADYGEEIVSVKYFTVNNTGYFIGMSTRKQYVLFVGRVNEHIFYLYIFAGAVSLALLVLALALCLTMHKGRKEYERAKKIMADNIFQNEELAKKLASKAETAKNASIYDNLTKLYNRKFFYNLLPRINDEHFQPISIVVLDINGLDRLNRTAYYRTGDELLEKVSGILQRLCIDTDIAARTGSSEFSILMTSASISDAYGVTENIRRQFTSLAHTGLTMSIGAAQMHQDDSNVFHALDRARKNLTLEKLNDKNSSNYRVIAILMEMLGAYSPEAVAHCNRVREKAAEFGRSLGLSNPEISRLSIAAQLHDVGKIGISDNILNKKEILTTHEKDFVRRHPMIGYEIVRLIPPLDEVAADILQHHEYYDGTGYPAGLKGEEISLYARIINVIDSYDAMTNKSVYAKTKTPEEAIYELEKKSSAQFDPHIVSIFVREIQNNLIAGSDIA